MRATASSARRERGSLALSEKGLMPTVVSESGPVVDYKDCLVTTQDPLPGTDSLAPRDRQVEVECAGQRPAGSQPPDRRIPEVVGEEDVQAEGELIVAGFSPRVIGRPRSPSLTGLRTCRVRKQSKTGMAPPGTNVRLRLRCKEEQPTQDYAAPSGSEDPNELPASPGDLDCRDVDGPVAVDPSDPDRLDRDGDSVGCE